MNNFVSCVSNAPQTKCILPRRRRGGEVDHYQHHGIFPSASSNVRYQWYGKISGSTRLILGDFVRGPPHRSVHSITEFLMESVQTDARQFGRLFRLIFLKFYVTSLCTKSPSFWKQFSFFYLSRGISICERLANNCNSLRPVPRKDHACIMLY